MWWQGAFLNPQAHQYQTIVTTETAKRNLKPAFVPKGQFNSAQWQRLGYRAGMRRNAVALCLRLKGKRHFDRNRAKAIIVKQQKQLEITETAKPDLNLETVVSLF